MITSQPYRTRTPEQAAPASSSRGPDDPFGGRDLLNVLRGDMSLVGPRPLVLEKHSQAEGWHRRHLHLTPGRTGPWQIPGSARVPLNEMVEIDYVYVANWSLWTDIKILLRTVPYMLRRGGV